MNPDFVTVYFMKHMPLGLGSSVARTPRRLDLDRTGDVISPAQLVKTYGKSFDVLFRKQRVPFVVKTKRMPPKGLRKDERIVYHISIDYVTTQVMTYNTRGDGYGMGDNLIGAWLRQVLEWQDDIGDQGLDDLAEQINQAIHDERIYVFTRDGHVIDMQAGATPLDFAYHIHTEVGHGCRGAKVNGRIVPITYKLQTGEQIDIMTQRGGSPSRDWMNPSLGYLGTGRALAKVRHWFKQQDREGNLAEGRVLLERELSRLGLHYHRAALDKIASRFNVRTGEDVLVALGAGDLPLARVAHALHEGLAQPSQEQLALPELPVRPARQTAGERSGGIVIEGVGNLLTHIDAIVAANGERVEAIGGIRLWWQHLHLLHLLAGGEHACRSARKVHKQRQEGQRQPDQQAAHPGGLGGGGADRRRRASGWRWRSRGKDGAHRAGFRWVKVRAARRAGFASSSHRGSGLAGPPVGLAGRAEPVARPP